MTQITQKTQMIKNKTIVNDDWFVLRLSESDVLESVCVPSEKTLVPLSVWLQQKDSLLARQMAHKNVGIWFASHEQAKQLGDDAQYFDVIAVDFPKFTDGRGYSIAFNLRTRLHYDGELRAIGDVLRDQLFYMQRVGFDAFVPRADKNIQDALKGLSVFSERYQTSVDIKQPLFRRVKRVPRDELAQQVGLAA